MRLIFADATAAKRYVEDEALRIAVTNSGGMGISDIALSAEQFEMLATLRWLHGLAEERRRNPA